MGSVTLGEGRLRGNCYGPGDRPDALAAALAGRYRLERVLRRGGMATVHLARDEKHGRGVSLKVLRPDLSGWRS